MGPTLRTWIEPLANWFVQLGIPEPIVHWGHPVLMGIVVFVMGGFVTYAGWRGRAADDPQVAVKNKQSHAKIAPLMFVFIVLGATGGILSLVMQGEPILESPHFWTGMTVIGMLGLNAAIALFQFGKGDKNWRTFHAYWGSTAIALLLIHVALGINLGLSI
ncbi:DUF4079 domain-containing protein [Romeria aff. gracilis LEGE 07310]|uniref:DUF4079 domain-containing protein n=1 Tax=Vasconcelosia minhoensis LEGE 07310 TaxID=915328 RepID=A0A8J7ALQ7_9CYAN|nr:DUF4079 domain-containing protein [Romeria gracilis]MBE9080248.1 DUF4079 domain-containing protein [Romeria aff. gracilis LEGE 07310]